jgi:acyl-CoA thioesterase
MDIKEFLQLHIDKESGNTVLEALPENCNALKFLYGGAGLAAAIYALESTTERPLIWTSCQFNNFAKVGSTIDLKIEESVRGRNVCHASVDALIERAPAFKVLATLGERDHELSQQFIEMPQLDKPEDCPKFGGGKRISEEGKRSIDSRVEYRVARGSLRKDKAVPGQMALWARVPELSETSAASLAIMADYLPVSVGSMLKRPAGGNSLDNHLRILKLEQSEWVLCDCEVKGLNKGFAHASMNIWSESGALMACASQSIIFREFDFKK